MRVHRRCCYNLRPTYLRSKTGIELELDVENMTAISVLAPNAMKPCTAKSVIISDNIDGDTRPSSRRFRQRERRLHQFLDLSRMLRSHSTSTLCLIPSNSFSSLEDLPEAEMIGAHPIIFCLSGGTIPGEITLSAIDGEETDPSVQISNDNCLWDTGAHYCSISADLVTMIDPTFLELEVHENYRMQSNIGVLQESGVARHGFR